MPRPTRACSCAAIIFATLLPVAALEQPSAPRLHFEHVGRESGLSAEMITSIYQDRVGFIWIGTRQGLYMFDGVGFRRFQTKASDPDSLGDDTVRTIFEDSHGRFWVGTNSAGLELLDRASWKFRHFRHEAGNSRSLSHDSVNAIAEDRGGRIWIGTQQGLNRLSLDGNSFEQFLPDPVAPKRGPAGAYIYALYADRDDVLWVGMVGGGLSLRDPVSGEFRHLPPPAGQTSPISVITILPEDGHVRWLGTGAGICSVGPGDAIDCRAERELSTTITSLSWGDDGRIWAGSLDGLFEFDPQLQRFEFVEQRQVQESRQPGASRIVSLLKDRSGALWVGSFENGLDRARPPSPALIPVKQPEDQSTGAKNATAVLEDRSGRLWVATAAGAVFHERVDGRLEPIEAAEISHSQVTWLSLTEDPRGHIWMGSMLGLTDFDPVSRKVVRYGHSSTDPNSLGAGYVAVLTTARDGSLWLGTGEGGLQRLRPDRRGFDHYRHDATRPDTLSDDYVTAILEAQDGMLWVGTRSGGLNRFDRNTGKALRIPFSAARNDTLSHHQVTSLAEGADGTIWVGTGGGLNAVKVQADRSVQVRRFGSDEGIADDNIMSLAIDDDGSLWIATRGGLSRFDPRNRNVVSYRQEDGLPSDEFNHGSASRGMHRLHFGTLKGAISVRRGTTLTAPPPSPTVISSMRTLNGPLLTADPAWAMQRIAVRYGTVLLLDVAVLDATDPLRNRYAYRYADANEWIDLGSTRSITFDRLEPGEHRLLLRGRNAAGVWSEAAPLTIEVVPPFWRTLWFQFASVMVLAGGVVVVHRLRTDALKRRNRELLSLQEQRERALTESRQKEEQLRAAYDNHRTLTRRLELAKEDERKRIARELHDELGQALTAAKITLDLVEHGRVGGRDETPLVGDTSSLIQRIIDRVRDMSLDLRPPLLDERGLLAALRAFFDSHARRSGVSIQFDAGEEWKKLPPEIEMTLFRVVQEALTNSLRHAAAQHVWVDLEQREAAVSVAIRDDGQGFDVEAALQRAAAGRHLGLLGIRERVESLNGSVEFRSRPGHGTELHATLPTELPR